MEIALVSIAHTVSALQHSIKLANKLLTVTKKNPGQSMFPGLLQVAASACRLLLIRAAGVSGDGMPPGSGLSIVIYTTVFLTSRLNMA
jgi:hypothetical protein